MKLGSLWGYVAPHMPHMAHMFGAQAPHMAPMPGASPLTWPPWLTCQGPGPCVASHSQVERRSPCQSTPGAGS
jgi:hypothetical protein